MPIEAKVFEGTELKGKFQQYAPKAKEAWICSPFITMSGVNTLLAALDAKKLKKMYLLTRYSPHEWAMGATDINALREVFRHCKESKVKLEARLVQGLHSKAFVFDKTVALVGSFNLTAGGLDRNLELGIELNDGNIKKVLVCLTDYWDGGEGFDTARLDELEKLITPLKAKYDEERKKFMPQAWHKAPLMEFPHKKLDGIEYFSTLQEIMARFQKDGSAPDKVAKRWLNQISPSTNPKADTARLRFLQGLNFLSHNNGDWAITKRGREFMRKKGARAMASFYERLKLRHSSFGLIEKELLALHSDGIKSFSAKDIAKRPSLKKLGGKRLDNRAQIWALRLRWLQSLRLLKGERHQEKRYSITKQLLRVAVAE